MVEVSGAELVEETSEIQTQQPNILENKWAFWFDNQSKPKVGAAWGSSLCKAYTFDSIPDFWWYILHFILYFFYVNLLFFTCFNLSFFELLLFMLCGAYFVLVSIVS